MLEQRFWNEVLGPLQRFLERSGENVCIHEDSSDIISLGIHAASSAYHFYEVMHRQAGATLVPPFPIMEVEKIRNQLADIVNTAKHGVLRKKERQVHFFAQMLFEINDDNKFRYLRTEVFADSKIYGKINVQECILAFIKALIEYFKLNIKIEISVNPGEFRDKMEIYLLKKSGIQIQKSRIQICKRALDGQYEPFDPIGSVELVVIEPPERE